MLALRGQLEAANAKYRSVTEQVATYKQRLEKASADAAAAAKSAREKEHALEQLKLQAVKTTRSLATATAELERARQQKLAAEHQVAKTRATLSFQLGYLLIHGFKSWRAFRSLPGALWGLRQEAGKRREDKKARAASLILGRNAARGWQAPAAVRKPPAAPANLPAATVQAPPAPTPVARGAAPAVIVPAAPAPAAMTPSMPQAFATQQPIGSTAVQQQPVATTGRAPLALDARALRALKVAAIMDDFTYSSYKDECTLLQLTPSNWLEEIAQFGPQLLLIESAWRGRDELWGNRVGHTSQELVDIVAWCNKRGIATAFWNKEDPVHFETFLTTAKLFDYVFTTDIDCIHRYKAALGHDRVRLLPFAAQPKFSNPIEIYERKDAFCFAGAYYVRYPERTRDLGNFVGTLAEIKPVEIYDRNYGTNDPNYQFPPEYQPYIVGNLPFDEIDKAYKGYRYAINLNSIKQSQSMFARRVFELLASNTVTVSNFSRGVRLLFGDLVVTTDSGTEVARRIKKCAGDESRTKKLRLAALRKVMREHTYQDRFAYLVGSMQGQAVAGLMPEIAVTASAKDQSEFEHIVRGYRAQSYPHKRLIVVVPAGFSASAAPDDASIRVVSKTQIEGKSLRDLAQGCEWLAGWVAGDYYGPNYLLDLALATRYCGARVIGKMARYTWTPAAGLTLVSGGQEYKPAPSLAARRAIVAHELVGGLPVHDWLGSLDTRLLDAPAQDGALAIDEFNYCENGCGPGFGAAQIASVNDLAYVDIGIELADLLARAERIPPAEAAHDDCPLIEGSELAGMFKLTGHKALTFNVVGNALEVASTLPDGKHEYLYANTDHTPAELGFDRQVRLFMDTTPGLNLQVVVLFLDAQKQRISHVVKSANRNHEAEIPMGTAWIRLGLRVYASGSARLQALVLGHRPLQPAEVIGRSEHLLLTNHYPSYDDLYRNGFVHSRARAYREHDTRVDVFRLRAGEGLSYHEHENVDVITGSQEALHKLLSGGRYRSVLVHFLDTAMWEVLAQYIDRVKVLVWVHGAEIQPWHRRDYNYTSEEERTIAKAQSDKRMAFWRGVLDPMHPNLKLIFVSQYFADEVMEDTGIRLTDSQYAVIHNPIDTEFFEHVPKTREQRKKILSIRPYASATYANDLSVRAIQWLSTKPFFKDLEFRMIGDGKLFDETLAPLRDFENVYVERRFLSRHEIAELHRSHGIFLCPSRMDTQGVSRDEAMSSGLVPITNQVGAIPEFVDAGCAIVAPPEDHLAIAQGICTLYEDADRFLAMSKAATVRVRNQSDKAHTIKRELELFE